MRSGKVNGIQSPDIITSRSAGASDSPRPDRYSTSISISVGTVFHSVTRSRDIHSAQRAGSRLAHGSGITTVPPAASMPNRSYTDRSNDSDDTASTRSSGPTPKRWLMSTIVLTAPR
jgi:hypothetical protein